MRNNTESLIRSARIELYYSQMPAILVADVVTIWVSCYALWNDQSYMLLSSWAIINTLLALVFAFFVHRFNVVRRKEKISERPWDMYMVFLFFLAGVVWGSAPWLIMDHLDSVEFIVLLSVLLGVTAGVVPVLSGLFSSLAAYAIPLMGLTSIRLFFEDRSEYQILGSLCLIYLAANLFFSKKIANSLDDTLRLRFENLDLVAALRDQKNAAISANQAKSRFLAAASHDLRQPLHALSLFTGALLHYVSNDEGRRVMGRIEYSLDVLHDLFNALLDVSKLDAGVITPRCQNFDLAKLLNQILNEFEQRAAEKNILLLRDYKPLIVRSDPILLGRIMRNLVSNSIKYTESGSVKVSLGANGGKVCFMVEDSGVGITDDEINNIFIEFYQLHNPGRDRSKGLGLGLSIVKRLVELLGHKLTVTSKINEGSVFCVEMPLGDSEFVDDSNKNPKIESVDDLAGLNILVIDDEAEIRAGMESVLNQWGCVSQSADGINTSMEVVKCGFRPRIIIADYRLADGVSGIDAIRSVQEELGYHCSALLITGDTDPERLVEAQNSNYYLLHKPVKPASLRLALQKTTCL